MLTLTDLQWLKQKEQGRLAAELLHIDIAFVSSFRTWRASSPLIQVALITTD
jgi:hypothetical protein